MRTTLPLLLLALVSCDDGPAPDPHDPTRRALLVSFADGFTLPTLDTLVTRTEALQSATETYAASLDAADRAAAQEAWRSVMDTVQRLEMGQVGPAGVTLGAMGGVLGGEELRANLYSWPLNSPCRVDQATASDAHRDVDALAAETFGARGLDALEYLLFNDDVENLCSSVASLNTDGTWEALEGEIVARRAVHSRTAATLVHRTAQTLQARWRDGYRDTFAMAGQGSAVYATVGQAVSSLFGALLYVDTSVKDMKVGVPAGLVDCTQPTCPEDRESLFADASIAHIQTNLEALGAIVRGPDGGTGFDDLLVAVGAGDLATRVDAAIVTAQGEADALSGSLADLLAADADALLPLFTAVKSLSDLLKTEVVAALDIDLSFAPLDND